MEQEALGTRSNLDFHRILGLDRSYLPLRHVSKEDTTFKWKKVLCLTLTKLRCKVTALVANHCLKIVKPSQKALHVPITTISL